MKKDEGARSAGTPPETTERANTLRQMMRHVMPEPNSGCWLYETSEKSGRYPMIKIGGRRGKARRAHRVSWELHRGAIPAGQWVLHRCDTPACVNPDHLFLGTNQDNVDDRERKGRNKLPTTPKPRSTHCPAGHAYTPETAILDSNGHVSECRICNRERCRQYRARRRSNNA